MKKLRNRYVKLSTMLETMSIKQINIKSAKETGCAHNFSSAFDCKKDKNKNTYKKCQNLPVCNWHYKDFNCKNIKKEHLKLKKQRKK